MTKHPARAVGQRWRWQQGSVDKEFVIERRNERDNGWIVSFPGEVAVRDYEPWFGDSDWAGTLCTLTLLSQSASPASGPPEGYVPCPKGCGRWKANRGQLMCWRCFLPNATADMLGRYDRAGCGDWTPPLESKPAETCACGQEDDEPHTPGCPAAPPAEEAP